MSACGLHSLNDLRLGAKRSNGKSAQKTVLPRDVIVAYGGQYGEVAWKTAKMVRIVLELSQEPNAGYFVDA